MTENDKSILVVTSDSAGDQIMVYPAVDDGRVLVNGLNPSGGPVYPASLGGIRILGNGGNDTVLAQRMGSDSGLPGDALIEIRGGEGDDGLSFSDHGTGHIIDGGNGDDRFHAFSDTPGSSFLLDELGGDFRVRRVGAEPYVLVPIDIEDAFLYDAVSPQVGDETIVVGSVAAAALESLSVICTGGSDQVDATACDTDIKVVQDLSEGIINVNFNPAYSNTFQGVAGNLAVVQSRLVKADGGSLVIDDLSAGIRRVTATGLTTAEISTGGGADYILVKGLELPGLDAFFAQTGSGNDLFEVYPSTTTRVSATGSSHGAAPFDRLIIHLEGIPFTQSSGQVNPTGFQYVRWSSIETIELIEQFQGTHWEFH